MNNAYWTHKDEERCIEYQTLLGYEVDENNIQILSLDLLSVTDWFYNPKQGAVIEYPDEEALVRKWLFKQIRESEPVRESATEACREDYANHLEVLHEKAKGII